jgi:hypothetical protein
MAVPDLTFLVAGPAKEHELTALALRHDDRDRVRLRKSGQIAEVAVLTERVVHVAVADHLGSGGDDQHAIRADGRRGLASTAFELFLGSSCEHVETLDAGADLADNGSEALRS